MIINYPLGFKDSEENSKEINYKSRGMSFEGRINKTNDFYRRANIALINKRPTPIRVIEFDKNSNLITKAVFDCESTTDYNGIYQGRYIDFEAKSTQNLTSFPLSNLEDHQYKHLAEIDKQEGISFLLIEFSKLDEIYLLPFKKLELFLATNKRHSIPLKWLEKNAYKVETTLQAYVHYLENIDEIFNL